jgi:hypothetical protein
MHARYTNVYMQYNHTIPNLRGIRVSPARIKLQTYIHMHTYIVHIFTLARIYMQYNHTIPNLRGISVSPARIESTCHMLAFGTDLFYSRV